MPFHASIPLPDVRIATPVCRFVFDAHAGQSPSRSPARPIVCGLTNQSWSLQEVQQRTEWLAAGLALRLGWSPNQGSEWDKVVALFSVNSIDTPVIFWATHRLGGVHTPANAAYSVSDLEHQLKNSGAKCLFTSVPHLPIALSAAKQAGMKQENVFLMNLPWLEMDNQTKAAFTTVDDLILAGKQSQAARPLEHLEWPATGNHDQTAFLCYSSGTSGLPKGVKVGHRNINANILQLATHRAQSNRTKDGERRVMGLLPFSHIFGLTVILHCSFYCGDTIVVLPRFELSSFLRAIDRFGIDTLFVVPPIIVHLLSNRRIVDKFQLSSVVTVYVGAAPLGLETIQTLRRHHPDWDILQAYGLTEAAGVVSSSIAEDYVDGSSGSLVPGVDVRLVDVATGREITHHDVAGELWVRSPGVAAGYLAAPDATADSFTPDGFFKTGDEVVIRQNPKTGTDHLFIVDRLKDLIKVSGFQVAPAELESLLLTHEYVDDCAVVPISDPKTGEAPRAYVVLSSGVPVELKRDEVAAEICLYVEKQKSRYKWLRGGVRFIDQIPKSPSGKILRRMLRDTEGNREKRTGKL